MLAHVVMVRACGMVLRPPTTCCCAVTRAARREVRRASYRAHARARSARRLVDRRACWRRPCTPTRGSAVWRAGSPWGKRLLYLVERRAGPRIVGDSMELLAVSAL